MKKFSNVLKVEKWRDDYHITKSDGVAIDVDGNKVFSSKEDAQLALDKFLRTNNTSNKKQFVYTIGGL